MVDDRGQRIATCKTWIEIQRYLKSPNAEIIHAYQGRPVAIVLHSIPR